MAKWDGNDIEQRVNIEIEQDLNMRIVHLQTLLQSFYNSLDMVK